MENSIYTSLSRLEGLKSELAMIANNIANVSTTGFKRQGIVFSETIVPLEDANSSLSMATAEIQLTDFSQGGLTHTGNSLDLAIDGDGFFLVETQSGQALTRSGNFKVNLDGDVVTDTGHRLIDEGGGSIVVPPNADSIKVSSDGSLSIDGDFVTKIAVFDPPEGENLNRTSDALFPIQGTPQPKEDFTVLQGFQEDSNVNAIIEVARLIEVQRAYERGSTLNQSEDERIRELIRTLGN